ncbi:hypothetical protein MJO28_012877 [Puccinia striiformis f. sp. tritici]|uniref:Uncharacterized protein n=1 Tax=Puccinia striiformis f. sp. tritici TaxID=168172 RepID=A0ACC0DWR0_9BASI|nr:hypothetical protein MJO28_012877 [Puccinia striiformis f. sp. tritici]
MNFIKLTLLIFLAGMSEFTMAWDQDCGGSPGAQYACAYWSGYLDNIMLSPTDHDCSTKDPRRRYCCPRNHLQSKGLTSIPFESRKIKNTHWTLRNRQRFSARNELDSYPVAQPAVFAKKVEATTVRHPSSIVLYDLQEFCQLATCGY